jgi:hypothetical protein
MILDASNDLNLSYDDSREDLVISSSKFVNVDAETVDLSNYEQFEDLPEPPKLSPCLLIENLPEPPVLPPYQTIENDVHVNSMILDALNNLNLSYDDSRDVLVISSSKYVNVDAEMVELSNYVQFEELPEPP